MPLHSPRVLALDDGFFPPSYKGGAGRTVLVGVVYKDMPIDMSLRLILVDGRDASEKASEICGELLSRGLKPQHVLTDGVTYAGFNYISLESVSEACRAPATAVFKYRPDPEAMERALRRHFPDHEERWRIIEPQVRGASAINTRRGVLYVYSTLKDREAVRRIVEALQTYSPTPEPLRIADMVASAAAREMLRAGVI